MSFCPFIKDNCRQDCHLYNSKASNCNINIIATKLDSIDNEIGLLDTSICSISESYNLGDVCERLDALESSINTVDTSICNISQAYNLKDIWVELNAIEDAIKS